MKRRSIFRTALSALLGLGLVLIVGIPALAASGEASSGEMGGSSGEPDEALAAILEEVQDKFTTDVYEDEATGLSVTCDVFVPEDIDGDEQLPVVFFITDSSTVGRGPEASLTQGWGGVIWATEAEQEKHPCIVIVPTFDEVILDDHSGFVTTDYIDLMPRLVRTMAERYNGDMDRLYATGQSMGCMTFLLTAAKDPDLFAAEIFVDGQWDITTLTGLEDETFFYIVAGGDQKAVGGQDEVRAMLDEDGVPYSYAEGWDAQADAEELTALTEALLEEGTAINMIRWEPGTVLNGGSGMEHMASFDYAYKLEAVRDWLFEQSK